MQDWRKKAIEDLQEIVRYWDARDSELSDWIEDAIIDRVLYYEFNPATGRRVEGLGPTYKRGSVFKRQTYNIYYRITAPGTIRILMIRDARRKQPTPGQIRRRG